MNITAVSYTHLPEFKIGLMHGKMKAKLKEEVMDEFVRGEINILVSTTVIEVGVNAVSYTHLDVYKRQDITYTDAEDNTEKTTSRQAVQFSLDKSAVAGFEQAE